MEALPVPTHTALSLSRMTQQLAVAPACQRRTHCGGCDTIENDNLPHSSAAMIFLRAWDMEGACFANPARRNRSACTIFVVRGELKMSTWYNGYGNLITSLGFSNESFL
jgi:hypothetical protein